jgi:hypothetical protein
MALFWVSRLETANSCWRAKHSSATKEDPGVGNGGRTHAFDNRLGTISNLPKSRCARTGLVSKSDVRTLERRLRIASFHLFFE